ncbi:MAG: aminoacyl-tRNA hydrolase [Bacteroidetes bacterium]|nr:aminoacyl-tRNA hydrolase [Bacteroidota bacterium]MBP7399443.1 aminoacyl-tRNA hydrolase [Chitinophagales bacterium]MBK7107604.1 aminoacyl-tRNA hydrolase [Bacteroidota bacterium]MBK8486989.1 aminoacyl-tRNA hydrolase [Bacteroidota bacterium]MBK8680358.1 aminoacyl-tRNA hydrolase [Bacteroidota bacterium]
MIYLIAALGNIGLEYANTRHNAGFLIADAIARKHNVVFKDERLAAKIEFRIKNKILHVIKPTTYMNLSGRAVKYWMDTLQIPTENLLVITDDINLPFGKLRIRTKGSHGGHNGLASIQDLIGTADYSRLRFGVGNNFTTGRQVDYVLGQWSNEEKKELEFYIKIAGEAVEEFALAGPAITMNKFNT